MVSQYFRFVRDAMSDPFYPASVWVAPFWVIWNWIWLIETYKEIDAE